MPDQRQYDDVPFDGPEPGVPVDVPDGPDQRRTLRMADQLGRAYRHLTVAMSVLEQLAGSLDGQDAGQRPTAGELVRQGVPVESALRIVDGQRDRLGHLTGRPR